MENQEQFLSDIKGILSEKIVDNQQVVDNALFTMDHFNLTSYILGGKYTKTGKVAKFNFKYDFDAGCYVYLGFVQDEPFTEIPEENTR